MYKLEENTILYEDSGKSYLINSLTGKIFQLNEVAQLIVNGIKEGLEEGAIVSEILKTYADVQQEDIMQDFNLYINNLLDKKMISPVKSIDK